MPKAGKDLAIVALVTMLDQPETLDLGLFTGWLVRLMMSGARFPGYWSGEIIPPSAKQKEWRLVQRFLTDDDVGKWRESTDRRKIIQEMEVHLHSSGTTISEELSLSFDSEVATAIVTDVKPGMEEEYFAWECKIQTAQASRSGFRGAYLQPPAPGRQGQWATLLRFDTPQSLEEWFAAPERQELLAESDKFVKAVNFHHIDSSFPGWIPLDASGRSPPNWKTAMLVLLGLFPLVLLELRFLSPSLTALQPALRTFITLVGSVSATTWVTMPLFIRLFKWWLYPSEDLPPWKHVGGTLIVIGAFVVEIVLLWDLIPGRS